MKSFLRTGLTISVFLVAAVGATAAQTAPSLARAQQLLRDGNLQAALAMFEQMKQQDPSDARPYYLVGTALVKAGDLRGAAVELERAVELDPNQAEYALVYGEVLTRTGKRSEAEAALTLFESDQTLAQLDPTEQRLLSDVLYRLGKYEAAERVLSRYEETHPFDEQVWFRLGQIYLETAQLDEALRRFEYIRDKSARKAPGYYGVGYVLFLKNDLPAAEEALRKSLELAPGTPDYVVQLADALLAQERPQDAIRELSAIEPQGETYPKVFHGLGRAYRRLGETKKAADYFQRFEKVDRERKRVRARNDRVQIFLSEARGSLEQGRLRQALSHLQAVVKLDENNWAAHNYLARLYLQNADWSDALRHLTKLDEIDPKSFEPKFLLATYWYRRRDFSRAAGFAEEAKRRRPDVGELRNLLGNIYFSTGQRQKAIEEYQAAVNLSPDRTDFQLNLRTAKGGP